MQLNVEFVKIWSVSSHRLMTYSRDDVPHDCGEGDWIDIEFDSSGVLTGIRRVRDSLETRRDETGVLKVLDVFLIDSRREEAFSETFGVVRIEGGSRGERWIEHDNTYDYCFLLWTTVSSNVRFSIEQQSLDRVYSKSGKYSEKYKRLVQKFESASYRNVAMDRSNEPMELDETVLIVGHDLKTNTFYSSSRSGEGFIYSSLLNSSNGGNSMEIGAVFRVRLEKCGEGLDIRHRVVVVYERANLWNGVKITIPFRDMNVELTAEVVERRKTCFALETDPFGLVTYPLDREFLKCNFDVGDKLRVVVIRYKNRANDDHPSKWQVVRVVEQLKTDRKNEREWFEGVVTSVTNVVFITFKHGSAAYVRGTNGLSLSLGDIVHITVIPNRNKSEGWFDVVDIKGRRRREDFIVEPSDRTKCNVFCEAEVFDRQENYFLLDTPIIGLAAFNLREAPREMEVGDVWRVKMLRRKDKRDSPSFWVAIDVVGPRISSQSNRNNETDSVSRQLKNEYSSREVNPSTPNISRDERWTTVFITDSDDEVWYSCCALYDPVLIPKKLNVSGRDLEKGSFYRIKLSKGGDGVMRAHYLDPRQFFPRDIQKLTGNANELFLKMWCYSRIMDVQESSFTVHNEVLGDAILLFKKAAYQKSLRVGDMLETLYYRPRKSPSNSIHWMVQKGRLARSRNVGDRGIGGIDTRREFVDEDQNDSERTNDIEEDGLIEKSSVKDSRVLDITRNFLKIAPVRDAFKEKDPATFEKIKLLVDKYYIRS